MAQGAVRSRTLRLEVRRIDDDDFAPLGLVAKVRLTAHKRQVAYTPRADECRACGLCVVACPQRAIELVPAVSRD